MIDWKALIRTLEARGWTRALIAEQCGLGYSTLCDIANGRSTEPRGNAAVRLSDMHRSGLGPPNQSGPVRDEQAA